MGFVEFTKASTGKKVAILSEDITRLEEYKSKQEDDITNVIISLRHNSSMLTVSERMQDVLAIIDNDFTKHIREQRDTLQERMDIPAYGGIQSIIEEMLKSPEYESFMSRRMDELNIPTLAEQALAYIIDQEISWDIVKRYEWGDMNLVNQIRISYKELLTMRKLDAKWLTRVLRQMNFDTDNVIGLHNDRERHKFVFFQAKEAKDIVPEHREDPYGRLKSEGVFTK